MFKRVEKKLAKKKNEEELGFTEEIKEAIGLNDVDSNDSSFDETDASGSTSSPQLTSKRKRLLDDELDASSDAASEGQGSGASDDPEDDDEDEPGVQMTVEEVLHDPLYIISLQPDIRGCIVCPQKLLKNDTMASVHTNSQAHRRRISKFKEAAASAKSDDDAQDVLSVAFTPIPLQPKPPSNGSAPLSNRAVKRIAKLEKMKIKRQKHKAAKARSIAAKGAKEPETKANGESKTSEIARTIEPPKKKPKLGRPSSHGKLVGKKPLFIKQKPDGLSDGNPPKREPASLNEFRPTGAKMDLKSRRTDKKRGKKEAN